MFNIVLSNLYPLISFCCLIAIATTSSTILNRYGESEKPFLVLVFNEISLNFSPFSLMLAVGLPLLCLHMFLVSPISPRPLLWRDVGFYQRLIFSIQWDDHEYFFSLHIWWLPYKIDKFSYVEPSYISGMKPIWSRWMIFCMFLNLVCQYFIEYFCITAHEGEIGLCIPFFVASFCGLGIRVTVPS